MRQQGSGPFQEAEWLGILGRAGLDSPWGGVEGWTEGRC